MTTATDKLTLEEYFNYENSEEQHWELSAGNLIQMPPESPQNAEIAIKLLLIFAQFVAPGLLRCKDTEIVVSGSRTTVRLPDLMVLTAELADALRSFGRSTIMSDMSPPALVVEVVSPGKVNQDRDYRYKRSEYAARGIAEYWIVDPQINKVTVLILNEGLYEEKVFEGEQAIASCLFPQLQLTAERIFFS
ncbi:Uma2 family endonuclease [Pleurocapsa sp. FMAR1]|uniref:Uma2 family endonuclease n=1 Tax=Pleurocapsa sp. FMAR1 TaxID=3040204 RepID=UPI0029C7FB0A|nr:Uma2 family endonuclease [Pleurocapsa sp. FMAR1]